MKLTKLLGLLLLCAPLGALNASAQIRGRHRKIFSGGGGGIAVTCVTGAGSFSGTSATMTIAAPTGSYVEVAVGTLIPANFTSLQTNLGGNLTQDSAGSGTNGFVPGGTNNALRVARVGKLRIMIADSAISRCLGLPRRLCSGRASAFESVVRLQAIALSVS